MAAKLCKGRVGLDEQWVLAKSRVKGPKKGVDKVALGGLSDGDVVTERPECSKPGSGHHKPVKPAPKVSDERVIGCPMPSRLLYAV